MIERFTPAQIALADRLDSVTPQLGAWARKRFDAGLGVAEVKAELRAAAKEAGK